MPPRVVLAAVCGVKLPGCCLQALESCRLARPPLLKPCQALRSHCLLALGGTPRHPAPAGNPAVFLRKLKPEETAFLGESAEHYARLAAEHAQVPRAHRGLLAWHASKLAGCTGA